MQVCTHNYVNWANLSSIPWINIATINNFLLLFQHIFSLHFSNTYSSRKEIIAQRPIFSAGKGSRMLRNQYPYLHTQRRATRRQAPLNFWHLMTFAKMTEMTVGAIVPGVSSTIDGVGRSPGRASGDCHSRRMLRKCEICENIYLLDELGLVLLDLLAGEFVELGEHRVSTRPEVRFDLLAAVQGVVDGLSAGQN
jgi:hypothetical protein